MGVGTGWGGVGLTGELGALSSIQEGCKVKLSLSVGTANTCALWEKMIPYSFLGGTPPNSCPAPLVLKVVDTDFAPPHRHQLLHL